MIKYIAIIYPSIFFEDSSLYVSIILHVVYKFIKEIMICMQLLDVSKYSSLYAVY